MKKIFWVALFISSFPCFAIDSASIYNSKLIWENQDGKKLTLESLKGTPVVATMLYTSCPNSCPLTMRDLRAIEKKLSAKMKKKVHFAVFTFDSERDTHDKLKAYMKHQKLDFSRWSFFHGDEKSVRELAAMLEIKYKKDENGEFDHSNVISVLNSEGVVVHKQIGSGQSPKESVAAIKQIIDRNKE